MFWFLETLGTLQSGSDGGVDIGSSHGSLERLGCEAVPVKRQTKFNDDRQEQVFDEPLFQPEPHASTYLALGRPGLYELVGPRSRRLQVDARYLGM